MDLLHFLCACVHSFTVLVLCWIYRKNTHIGSICLISQSKNQLNKACYFINMDKQLNDNACSVGIHWIFPPKSCNRPCSKCVHAKICLRNNKTSVESATSIIIDHDYFCLTTTYTNVHRIKQWTFQSMKFNEDFFLTRSLCACVLDDNDDDMWIEMKNNALSSFIYFNFIRFFLFFFSLANRLVLLGCVSGVDNSRSGNKIGSHRQHRSGTKTGYKRWGHR